MCLCDFEEPTVYWESEPTAKKRHVCCECRSSIPIGDKYHLFKGVWEGEFQSYKTCTVCQAVKEEAYKAGFDCIYFEQLWETVGVEFEAAAI